jgi:hypothetical protein
MNGARVACRRNPRHNQMARTAAERQILRILRPQLRPDGIAETSLFSMVLEDEMRRVLSQLVVEVTDKMLQAKMKDMDGKTNWNNERGE